MTLQSSLPISINDIKADYGAGAPSDLVSLVTLYTGVSASGGLYSFLGKTKFSSVPVLSFTCSGNLNPSYNTSQGALTGRINGFNCTVTSGGLAPFTITPVVVNSYGGVVSVSTLLTYSNYVTFNLISGQVSRNLTSTKSGYVYVNVVDSAGHNVNSGNAYYEMDFGPNL
jgi:hypothetical protein